MGNVKQALGDYDAAVPLHQKAIDLEPGLASAYNNLGNALRELRMPAAAVAVLEGAVAINPVYAAAYVNLGSAASANGMPDMAIASHTFASRLAPADPTVLNNLGAALQEAGRLAEADATYQGGLELQPESVTMRVNRGHVLKAQGRLDEAMAVYSEAVQVGAGGVDAIHAYNGLAATLQAAGSTQRAMQAYEAAIALSPGTAPAEVARRNLDKLPISTAYRGAAEYETAVLASRAARAALARGGARRADRARRRGRAPIAEPPAPLSPMLHRTVRYLRRLETEQVRGSAALWQGRASEMAGVLAGSGEADQMTLQAFAWGGVWYQTFAAALTSPQCRAALQLAAERPPAGDASTQPSAMVLGSSIGFEALFVALTYGLPTLGIELLPNLVQISEAVRRAHGVSSELVGFEVTISR